VFQLPILNINENNGKKHQTELKASNLLFFPAPFLFLDCFRRGSGGCIMGGNKGGGCLNSSFSSCVGTFTSCAQGVHSTLLTRCSVHGNRKLRSVDVGWEIIS